MRLRSLLGPIPNEFSAGSITILFIAFFVGLCWFVYRQDRRSVYQHIERLPLEEKDHD